MKRVVSFSLVAFLLGLAPAVTAQSAAPAPPAADAPAPAPPAPTAPSLAESLSGAAKDEYELGALLFKDRDFAGAALKFQHAYELSKDPRLLWNMAAAEKNLRHYAREEALLLRFLAEAGPTLSQADREEAQDLLDTLRAFIAEVTLKVNEAGASVAVDGVAVGLTPLERPLRVDMGARTLRVTKRGFRDYELPKTLAGDSKLELNVTLLPELHQGRLRIVAGENDIIKVDGKVVGFGQWQATLPSGTHHVEVSATGKQSWQADVLVQDGELRTSSVTLSSNTVRPKGIPAWLWVTGGAVAACGLGAGAYFVFRPEDKGPPEPLRGTLGTVRLPLR